MQLRGGITALPVGAGCDVRIGGCGGVTQRCHYHGHAIGGKRALSRRIGAACGLRRTCDYDYNGTGRKTWGAEFLRLDKRWHDEFRWRFLQLRVCLSERSVGMVLVCTSCTCPDLSFFPPSVRPLFAVRTIRVQLRTLRMDAPIKPRVGRVNAKPRRPST